MAINFDKNSFDNADSSFQGLGNLFNTFQLGSGIPGCTDPTQFNYNQNATVDDGSCVAFVYGCMDPNAFNYDCTTPVVGMPAPTGSCNDGVNVNNGTCIYPGCMDSAYAEYDPMANQDDGSCATLLTYGCTDVSTMTIGDGSGFAYDTYINGNASISNSCDGTNVPCVPNLSGVIPPVGTVNCCCIPAIVGCMDITAANYDATANTSPAAGSNLECFYTVVGCTDASADNFSGTANTDDGTCVYSGCTDAAADNTTYFNHPNPGALYTNPIIATIDDSSCTYTTNFGCTDDGTYTGFSATNYDPSAVTNDGSCEYNGCTYLDTGYTNNGVLLNPDATPGYNVITYTSQMLENFVTGGVDNYGFNGSFINDPTQITEDGSCTFYGCADDGACTIATCGYDSPYPGAAAVNYDPPVNHPAWPGAGINDNGFNCTYSHGCTDDSSGSDWWPDINGNDRDGNPCTGYNYLTSTTDCANGYNVINYDPNAAVDYGCQLPIPGCTDDTAYNYDASATHDDGSCTPCASGIVGCMDPLANNYEPCASVNNSTMCGYDGCIFNWADNYGCSQAYNPTATSPCGEQVNINISGFCTLAGCMDDTANNYDSNVTVDDGSCTYDPPSCWESYTYGGGITSMHSIGDTYMNQVLSYGPLYGTVFGFSPTNCGLLVVADQTGGSTNELAAIGTFSITNVDWNDPDMLTYNEFRWATVIGGASQNGITMNAQNTAGYDIGAIGAGKQNHEDWINNNVAIDLTANGIFSESFSIVDEYIDADGNAAPLGAPTSNYFLPSIGELELMWNNIGPNNQYGLGDLVNWPGSNFASLWSSTEHDADEAKAWGTASGILVQGVKSTSLNVRPVRRIGPEGCTDPSYTEYDSSAAWDDGSCVTLNNTLSLGSQAEGGTVVYLDGFGGGIVASNITLDSKYWSNVYTNVNTGNAVGDGQSNTDNIISTNGVDTGQAASHVDSLSLSVNGVQYNDWYLPSLNELALLSDNTGQLYSQINDGVALTTSDQIWSSSEGNASTAYIWNVAGNTIGIENKNDTNKVIAFRTF